MSKNLKNTLQFMNDVDAAVHRTGSRAAYLTSITIVLLLVSGIFWAKNAVLEEVTRGIGQVIPSTHVQVIQHLEGGILDELVVAENQIVEKEDLLLRIRNTTSASQYHESLRRAETHRAAIARLTAEAHGNEPDFKNVVGVPEEIIQTQRAIYIARQDKLASELRILESQAIQKQQEINELVHNEKTLKKSIENIERQLQITKPLVDQDLSPEVDYLSLENKLITQRGEAEALRFRIPKLQEAVAEVQQKSQKHRAEFRMAVLAELSQRRSELRALDEIIAAGKDRITRTDVRSPVRGTVKLINIRTVGGVVGPGAPIMEIVPMDDTLLIEARIRPSDIAFLYPGQKATIKITAYDFSIYGGMDAKVEQISADAIQDPRGETYFRVKLRTTSNALEYRGDTLPIIPGMTASVDILSGEKTVLEYLLKPILKARQNALRER